MPTILFRCPRCGEAGTLPADLAGNAAHCGACGQQFFRGSDKKFHGDDERDVARHRTSSNALPVKQRKQPRKRRVGLGVPLAAACVAVLGLAWHFGDGRAALCGVAAEAEEFTRYVAADDKQGAMTWVPTTAQGDFQRWLTLQCIETGRSTPRVRVEVMDQCADAACVRCFIKASGRGAFMQTQFWRKCDARWQFDAARTLANLERE